jgi:hypothetical protein
MLVHANGPPERPHLLAETRTRPKVMRTYVRMHDASGSLSPKRLLVRETHGEGHPCVRFRHSILIQDVFPDERFGEGVDRGEEVVTLVGSMQQNADHIATRSGDNELSHGVRRAQPGHKFRSRTPTTGEDDKHPVERDGDRVLVHKYPWPYRFARTGRGAIEAVAAEFEAEFVPQPSVTCCAVGAQPS